MKHGNDGEILAGDSIENQKRKAAHERHSCSAVDDGIGLRLSNDSLHASVDASEHVSPQSRALGFLSIDGLDQFVFRLRTKKDLHQSELRIRVFSAPHSTPSLGSSSNRSSRRSSSAVCASLRRTDSASATIVSQRSSTSWILSDTESSRSWSSPVMDG